MKIHVDTEKCAGHAVCQALAPDIFEVGDDQLTHVLMEDIPERMRETVQGAVDDCPTRALSLEG